MSIEYIDSTKRIVLGKNQSIVLTSKREECTRWAEVQFEQAGVKINLGGYFQDSVSGTNEWMEYNNESIAFLSKNMYTGDLCIIRIFDIASLQIIVGLQDQLLDYYHEEFSDNSKKKILK